MNGERPWSNWSSASHAFKCRSPCRHAVSAEPGQGACSGCNQQALASKILLPLAVLSVKGVSSFWPPGGEPSAWLRMLLMGSLRERWSVPAH